MSRRTLRSPACCRHTTRSTGSTAFVPRFGRGRLEERHREQRRKAIESIARLQLRREPDIVQRICIKHAKQQGSCLPLADRQDAGSRNFGDEFCTLSEFRRLALKFGCVWEFRNSGDCPSVLVRLTYGLSVAGAARRRRSNDEPSASL